MENQIFNPDDIDDALILVREVTLRMTGSLKAKGYPKAEVFQSHYGFSVYPNGMVNGAVAEGFGLTYDKATAVIDAIEPKVTWAEALCERSLYVGVL